MGWQDAPLENNNGMPEWSSAPIADVSSVEQSPSIFNINPINRHNDFIETTVQSIIGGAKNVAENFGAGPNPLQRALKTLLGGAQIAGAVPGAAIHSLGGAPTTRATGSPLAGAAVDTVLGLTAGPLANKGANAFQPFLKNETSAPIPFTGDNAASQAKYAQELVLPKQTPSEIAKTALQRESGGGIMNRQVYKPQAREAEMAKAAADAGVKKGAPLVDNLQTIAKFNAKEGERLSGLLAKNDTPIDPNSLNAAATRIAEKIASNPLVDEHGSTVRKLLELAQKSIDEQPKTAAGLLQARKNFDFAIEEFQPTAFDTDAPATAFRFAVRQIRQGINQTIADASPNIAVKASLRKQNLLYDAIDNISGKVSSEPTNRFGRFFAKPAGKAVKYGAGLTAAGAAGGALYNLLGNGQVGMQQ